MLCLCVHSVESFLKVLVVVKKMAQYQVVV